jgi:hypothetical protein
MKEAKNNQQQHKEPHNNIVHQNNKPYWKRAHQDWRFWIGLVLMLIAISIYIISDDFTIQPAIQEPSH